MATNLKLIFFLIDTDSSFGEVKNGWRVFFALACRALWALQFLIGDEEGCIKQWDTQKRFA